MTSYFTSCTALIHYPAYVIRELEKHFGDRLWQGEGIEFMADFGQLIQVGDVIVLENSEGRQLADLRYVKHISPVTIRNLSYLSKFGYTHYLVTARRFDNDTIYLHLEPQPVN